MSSTSPISGEPTSGMLYSPPVSSEIHYEKGASPLRGSNMGPHVDFPASGDCRSRGAANMGGAQGVPASADSGKGAAFSALDKNMTP